MGMILDVTTLFMLIYVLYFPSCFNVKFVISIYAQRSLMYHVKTELKWKVENKF